MLAAVLTVSRHCAHYMHEDNIYAIEPMRPTFVSGVPLVQVFRALASMFARSHTALHRVCPSACAPFLLKTVHVPTRGHQAF